MMSPILPAGMTRRHFLQHLATGSAMALPAMQFLSTLQAHAADVRKNEKACILVWLQGGPPSIDMWDMKPNSKNGGEFRPISSNADMQISEHLPKVSRVMDRLSLVRSMATREADHTRGSYYLHTSYVPNPSVVHPAFGSVVSYELGPNRPQLEIPAFVSIGGSGGGPGFLGMAHAPFVVDSNGKIRNVNMAGGSSERLAQRLRTLDVIEGTFIRSNRGDSAVAHRDVYNKALKLMSSNQLRAFELDMEDEKTRNLYGRNNFGNSLLMSRRLVQIGVPFVEVRFPESWDLHQNVFPTLRDQRLPKLDEGLSALVSDLSERGMLDHTVVLVMGEFGRTPRINANAGRDHWASSWTAVVGGGGLHGGRVVGETDSDGIGIIGNSFVPGDLWATVCHALGIPLDKVHESKQKRPMKIANGGTPINELIA